MSPDPKGTMHILRNLNSVVAFGKVTKIVGLVAEGSGIKAPLGSLCHILPEGTPLTKSTSAQKNAGSFAPAANDEEGIPVEVVGFRDGNLLFMPYGDLRGVQPGSLVRNSSLPPLFPVGNDLLGHAFDAFGVPLKPAELNLPDVAPIYADPPSPLTRP